MKAWVLFLGAAAAWVCLAASDEQEVKQLPEGPGKDVAAKVCLECHGAGNFRQFRLNKDGWEEQVGNMIDQGAKATEEEQTTLVEYLTRNFGPDSKVNVNTAPLVELKKVLDISANQAQAVIDFRAAKGDFKQWQELQKVPGMDAAKIEAKKDLIAF